MTTGELIERSRSQFSAKVLADSVNVCGNRLTTWEVTYPRQIHAEMCRHRIMSRNSASSRAIPIDRCMDAVVDRPFVPLHIGAAQKGMQAFSEVNEETKKRAVDWLYTKRWDAVSVAQVLSDLGVHKQVANRYLEPYLFITEIISTTSFRHFEILRDHKMAEPHIQLVARLMSKARSDSIPTLLHDGQWHLPLIEFADSVQLSLDDLKRVSVARCARVSYVRHSDRKPYQEDFDLHDRLVESKHLSPFEHVAQPYVWEPQGFDAEVYDKRPIQSGNFFGWKQYRKDIDGEFVPDEPYTGPVLTRLGN